MSDTAWTILIIGFVVWALFIKELAAYRLGASHWFNRLVNSTQRRKSGTDNTWDVDVGPDGDCD